MTTDKIARNPAQSTSNRKAPSFGCSVTCDPLLLKYHDSEWGLPKHSEAALLEALTLIGFQAGLSWLTILRKREAFRYAFWDFNPEAMAALTDVHLERLLEDPGIIRNERKIRAARTNARAVVALQDSGISLEALVWEHEPPPHPGRKGWADVPLRSPASVELAKALKAAGFQFVGPRSAYAFMQAVGMVNDHLESCWQSRPEPSSQVSQKSRSRIR